MDEIYKVGLSCLIYYKESGKSNEQVLVAWDSISKPLYCILNLQFWECERTAEVSFLFHSKPVRWLAPLCESIRTLNSRFVLPK